MLKTVCIAVAIVMLATGCDVRRKDKQAAPVAVAEEIKTPTTIAMLDSIYDFGSVAEGEMVEHSFRFVNTGNEPLVVSNVSASCGCTVADKPEAPVMQGDTGSIKVKFNSENRPGQAHKTVTVSSNAVPPFGPLVIKGVVVGKQ